MSPKRRTSDIAMKRADVRESLAFFGAGPKLGQWVRFGGRRRRTPSVGNRGPVGGYGDLIAADGWLVQPDLAVR